MADDSKSRFFTIEIADAKFQSGPNKGKRIESIGRYESSNPLSAGRKAATRIYGESGADAVTFMIRETTRGSGNPIFVYAAEKKKLKTPVSYTRKTEQPDGSVKEDVITKTTKNHVRAVRDQDELRAFYKKIDLPFPADIVDDDDDDKPSSKKKSRSKKPGSSRSKPKSKKAKTKGGGALCDTAAPAEFEDYKPPAKQSGGTTSCCQAAPADATDPAHLITTGGDISAHAAELAKANEMSMSARASADAARLQLDASHADAARQQLEAGRAEFLKAA